MGPDGAISALVSNGLLKALGAVVSGLGLGGIRGDVYLEGLDLDALLRGLIAEPLVADAITIDLAAGRILVDLDGLLGQPLNGAAPNTELLLNDTVVNAIVDNVTGLLQTWVSEVLDRIESALNGLVTPLLNGIAGLLTTTLFGVVDSLFTTLGDTVGAIVTALSTVLRPLPSVVSLMVNVQPDQPGAPGDLAAVADPATTGRYRVSALRLGLLDPFGSGGLVYAYLGTATVGPVTRR